MRAIDRVRRRQRWHARLDRLATAMVATLALVATITLLPQSWQQRLFSWGCQGITFGLTDCVGRIYEPPVAALRAVPLCDVDQVVEAMVPNVERQVISFARGGKLERWVERNGDIRLIALPESPDSGPVDGWSTDPWPTAPLLTGVDLPLSAQWTFPGGDGERDLVATLQQQHARTYQDLSAVAALLPAHVDADAARPTGWLTQVPLAEVITTELADPQPSPIPGRVRIAGSAAVLHHDAHADEVHTTVPSIGLSPEGADVQGVLRWTRGATGRPTELLGTWAWPQGGGTEVVHLRLPLAAGDDDDFNRWLATPGGPDLDLGFLLAQRAPRPGNDMETLIAAVGTVAEEQRAGASRDYVQVTWEHFARDRRPFGELDAERSQTLLVRPQPSGMQRTAQEIQC